SGFPAVAKHGGPPSHAAGRDWHRYRPRRRRRADAPHGLAAVSRQAQRSGDLRFGSGTANGGGFPRQLSARAPGAARRSGGGAEVSVKGGLGPDMSTLFDNDPPPPACEPLEKGAVLLRGFANAEAAVLVEEVARV